MCLLSFGLTFVSIAVVGGGGDGGDAVVVVVMVRVWLGEWG